MPEPPAAEAERKVDIESSQSSDQELNLVLTPRKSLLAAVSVKEENLFNEGETAKKSLQASPVKQENAAIVGAEPMGASVYQEGLPPLNPPFTNALLAQAANMQMFGYLMRHYQSWFSRL